MLNPIHQLKTTTLTQSKLKQCPSSFPSIPPTLNSTKQNNPIPQISQKPNPAPSYEHKQLNSLSKKKIIWTPHQVSATIPACLRSITHKPFMHKTKKQTLLLCNADHLILFQPEKRDNTETLTSKKIPLTGPLNNNHEWLLSFKKALETIELPKKIRFITPLHFEYTKWARIPKIKKRNQTAVLLHELQERMPYPAEKVHWFHQNAGEKNMHQDIQFFTIKKEYIEAFQSFFKKKNTHITQFIPHSLIGLYAARELNTSEPIILLYSYNQDLLISSSQSNAFFIRKARNIPLNQFAEHSLQSIHSYEQQTQYPKAHHHYFTSNDPNNIVPFPKNYSQLTDNSTKTQKILPQNNLAPIITLAIQHLYKQKNVPHFKIKQPQFSTKIKWLGIAAILTTGLLAINLSLHQTKQEKSPQTQPTTPPTSNQTINPLLINLQKRNFTPHILSLLNTQVLNSTNIFISKLETQLNRTNATLSCQAEIISKNTNQHLSIIHNFITQLNTELQLKEPLVITITHESLYSTQFTFEGTIHQLPLGQKLSDIALATATPSQTPNNSLPSNTNPPAPSWLELEETRKNLQEKAALNNIQLYQTFHTDYSHTLNPLTQKTKTALNQTLNLLFNSKPTQLFSLNFSKNILTLSFEGSTATLQTFIQDLIQKNEPWIITKLNYEPCRPISQNNQIQNETPLFKEYSSHFTLKLKYTKTPWPITNNSENLSTQETLWSHALTTTPTICLKENSNTLIFNTTTSPLNNKDPILPQQSIFKITGYCYPSQNETSPPILFIQDTQSNNHYTLSPGQSAENNTIQLLSVQKTNNQLAATLSINGETISLNHSPTQIQEPKKITLN